MSVYIVRPSPSNVVDITGPCGLCSSPSPTSPFSFPPPHAPKCSCMRLNTAHLRFPYLHCARLRFPGSRCVHLPCYCTCLYRSNIVCFSIVLLYLLVLSCTLLSCRVHACLCSSLTSPPPYIGNIHFTRLWDPYGISKLNKASVGVSGLAGVAAWLSKRT